MASQEILVATSYQSHIPPTSKELSPWYMDWLEGTLAGLEAEGYKVSNALRDNDFRIEDDPVAAHAYDVSRVNSCDAVIAVLDVRESRGVQTTIGRAEVLGKVIMLGLTGDTPLDPFNRSLVKAGAAHEIRMPLDFDEIATILDA